MLLRSRRRTTAALGGTSADKTTRKSMYNFPHKPQQKPPRQSKAIRKSLDHHEHGLSDTNIVQQGPCVTQGPLANAPILFCSLGHPLRTDCVEKGHCGANSQDETIHTNGGANSPIKSHYFYNHVVQEAMLTDCYPDTKWGDNGSIEGPLTVSQPRYSSVDLDESEFSCDLGGVGGCLLCQYWT